MEARKDACLDKEDTSCTMCPLDAIIDHRKQQLRVLGASLSATGAISKRELRKSSAEALISMALPFPNYQTFKDTATCNVPDAMSKGVVKQDGHG